MPVGLTCSKNDLTCVVQSAYLLESQVLRAPPPTVLVIALRFPATPSHIDLNTKIKMERGSYTLYRYHVRKFGTSISIFAVIGRPIAVIASFLSGCVSRSKGHDLYTKWNCHRN